MFVHSTKRISLSFVVHLSITLLITLLLQETIEKNYVCGYASSARLNRLQRQRTIIRSPSPPPFHQRTIPPPPPSSFKYVPPYIQYRNKQKKNNNVNAVVSIVKLLTVQKQQADQFVQNIRSSYSTSRSLEACTALSPDTKRMGHHQILQTIDVKTPVYMACVVLKLSATMGRFSGYTFADSSPANWFD